MKRLNVVNPTVTTSIALEMAWQLAIAVLGPILAGSFIDKIYKTYPLFVSIGMIIAAFAMIIIVSRTIKKVNDIDKIDAIKINKTNKDNTKDN